MAGSPGGGQPHPFEHRDDVVVVFDDKVVAAVLHQSRQTFEIRTRTLRTRTGVELRIDERIFHVRVDHHVGDFVVQRHTVEVTAADHHGNAVVVGLALVVEVTVHIRFVEEALEQEIRFVLGDASFGEIAFVEGLDQTVDRAVGVDFHAVQHARIL